MGFLFFLSGTPGIRPEKISEHCLVLNKLKLNSEAETVKDIFTALTTLLVLWVTSTQQLYNGTN